MSTLTPADFQIRQALEPIEDLLADPFTKEVQVRQGGRYVLVASDGDPCVLPGRTFPGLEHACVSIAGACGGGDLTEHFPKFTGRLDTYDARFSAILPPLARDGALMTIRRFPKRFTLDELVDEHMLSPLMSTLLRQAVLDRKSIMISGEGFSGKSTLALALLGCIPPGQSIFILEEQGEMVLNSPFVTLLQGRGAVESLDPNRRPLAPISLGDLLVATLLHSPGRIVVGEVKGAEAAAMLMAGNTGHKGGVCTIHANSANDALFRLAQCAALAGGSLPYDSLLADVGRLIDIVAHVRRDGSTRVIDHVIQVDAYQRHGTFLTSAFPSPKGSACVDS